jgi:hypothetical protein
MKLLWQVLAGVGALVCLAALGLTGTYVYNAGYLAQLAPEPKPVAPVTVRLFGPQLTVAGDRVYFHASVEGPAGPCQWRLVPDMPGALRVMSDSRTVEFSALEPGIYVLHVAVAGEGLQVASESIEFENLELVEEEEQPATPTVPLPPVPAAPTVAETTIAALSQVSSDDHLGEARIVAGCIKSLITRIQTGLVAPDSDLVQELELQVDVALGEQAQAWRPFISVVDGILASLRAQGQITTAASAVPALREIAATLLTAS